MCFSPCKNEQKKLQPQIMKNLSFFSKKTRENEVCLFACLSVYLKNSCEFNDENMKEIKAHCFTFDVICDTYVLLKNIKTKNKN